MASPLMIELGLHYHCKSTDHPDIDRAGPWADAVREFVDRGMLIHAPGPHRKYICTEALTVWVEALCAVGWPVKTWKIEEAKPPRRRFELNEFDPSSVTWTT